MSLISRSSRRTSCCMIASRRIPRRRRFDARQGFDGAAQRGQRILQFMRDIGGEALDRLDAAVERLGHLAERAREMADFVGAIGEVGDLLARLMPRRTRSAASASLRNGSAIVLASESESMSITAADDQEVSQAAPNVRWRSPCRCRGPASTAPGRLGSRSSAGSARATETMVSPVRIDADDRADLARERFGDLGQRFAVVRPVAASARRLGADEDAAQPRSMRAASQVVSSFAGSLASERDVDARELRVCESSSNSPSRS